MVRVENCGPDEQLVAGIAAGIAGSLGVSLDCVRGVADLDAARADHYGSWPTPSSRPVVPAGTVLKDSTATTIAIRQDLFREHRHWLPVLLHELAHLKLDDEDEPRPPLALDRLVGYALREYRVDLLAHELGEALTTSGFASASDANGAPVGWIEATWEQRDFVEIPLGSLPDALAEIRARAFSADAIAERVALYYNLLHDFATACAHLASGGQDELPLRLVQLPEGHVVQRNAGQIQAAFESQDEDRIRESLRLLLEDAGYGPLKFHRIRFLDSGDIWLPAGSELWL